jgi:uncharacterized membrane protein YidH (DUF202 family)
MKILRKWDFWYWFVFVLYFIVGYFHQISQENVMGLRALGDIFFIILSIAGATFAWTILKVIQICSSKFKSSQILWNKIAYVFIIVAMICLLLISIRYIYLFF